MSYRVVKPFNSTLRRHRVGDEVVETDDLSPHNIGSLKDAGLIEVAHALPPVMPAFKANTVAKLD